jgi:IMP dehydrogenase
MSETKLHMSHPLDAEFYLPADDFFRQNIPTGLTFDDVSLATRYSEILPKDASLQTRISESVMLQVPIISADMDTVTEAEMAIGMALHGGLGLIHYNMPEELQVKEVARVKNYINGLIQEPITIRPDMLVGDVLRLQQERKYSFSTFPVVGDKGELLGLISGKVLKHRYRDKSVQDAMTPKEQLFTIQESALGSDPIAAADRFFTENMGINKLLVVDREFRLRGMFTLSDIETLIEESQSRIKPARDSSFRLICGAAVSAVRKLDGSLDKERILRHITRLVQEGVDAVAVSTAHGHTLGVGETVRLLRQEFPDLTLIAGNVTSAAGVAYLAEAGANAIKVGQGPGSICTTRIVAGVGIPQLTALYVASREAAARGVSILADGGISKSGDMVKALTLANAVICGSLLAGCREAPGKIIEINGKIYKEYRGMGSMSAMKKGSASRYGREARDAFRKGTAEGIEALKELSGPLDEVLATLIGGLQSGMGYLGASTLNDLRERARYVRVTTAGMRESAPHDVVEIKTQKDNHG